VGSAGAAMSFTTDVRAFATKTGIKLDKVVRKVVIDMTREIVSMTPVDTGHARSNYFWGVSKVSSIDPAMSKNGSPSITRAGAFASTVKAGGVVYLTNNLPYIMKLEFGGYHGPSEKVTADGFSKQAAAGMGRIVVARIQAQVDALVGAVR
jgi:hypothetical protein